MYLRTYLYKHNHKLVTEVKREKVILFCNIECNLFAPLHCTWKICVLE